jgi:pilus assembly protein Flp/PilA
MAERRNTMLEMLKSFWTDESGQGLAEYAVLIALITLALVIVITPFRNAIIAVFNDVTTALTTR